MNKLIILAYLVLGGILFQITQTFWNNKANANEYSIAEEQLPQPFSIDFTFAAQKSLEAVVHIKSKYIEDEYYRYYHHLF